MTKCVLEIQDEVNCKFRNLDPKTRRKLKEELEYFIPQAQYTPAFKMGRWDGKASFCTMGGTTYINLVDRLLPIVQERGYEIEVDDQRQYWEFNFNKIDENVISDRTWPKGHPLEGEPIVLREHQVDVINSFLENTQSLQEAATSSGKTIITAVLSHLIEPYGRSIVIVPNRDLVTQTEADYRNIGLDVGVFYGGRKELGHKHIICTWQSLAVVDKNSKEYDENLMSDFLKDVVCVMVDECHTVKGKVLNDLLSNPFRHIPIRWGLTGTVPKEEHQFFNLLSTIGPVVNRLRAVDLQEKDVLSDCFISILQTQESVAFNGYDEERNFVLKDRDRLQFVWDGVIKKKISGGNTLILVEKVDTGKLLEEIIPNSKFISGHTKNKDRKEHYDSMNEEDDIILIATYGIASTGISINRLFNLVLIEPGKSFVRTIQSIGRGLRTARDKDFVNILDVCASTKYSKRHLTERKRYYKEAEYDHKVYKIKRY